MTTPEIKKVLDAFFYDPENDGIFKHIDDDDYIYRRDAFMSLHAEPDNPLSHLFGSPLSQIEDMVDAVKTRPMQNNPIIEGLKMIDAIFEEQGWFTTADNRKAIHAAITVLSTESKTAGVSELELKGMVADILNKYKINMQYFGGEKGVVVEEYFFKDICNQVAKFIIRERSQFKPLAAMPSDAIDFANWIRIDFNPTEEIGRWWNRRNMADTKIYTTAELYTAYLKSKGE